MARISRDSHLRKSVVNHEAGGTRPTLIVSDIFPPKTGGSGRWFWEIYSRLPRDQFVVAAGEHPQQVDFDSHHNLTVVRLPLEMRTRGIRSFANMKQYWRSVRSIRRLVKQHSIKMLHCGRCLPEGVIAYFNKVLWGTPYFCYVHGEEISVSSTSRELSWMVRRVFSAADSLIANSENTRQLLLNDWQIQPERVKLLYPGVDTNRFRPSSRNENVRAKLGWGNRRVILTVGRLQKRKGHDHFILALRELRLQFPDLLYCIIGDGEEAPNLRTLINEHSMTELVQILGEVNDEQLVECYQQCDLFVLPNRAVGKDIEGFGMVLLEAQACGKPVLAGASGGTAETMCIPETGRVVSCDDPILLANAVGELLRDKDLLIEMGKRGRQWVCDRFDWSALSAVALNYFTSAS